ncbi:MAG TPA: hypothetical protein VGR26_08470 [Acidimicrobiales bacterium]|nr:hypothetical protein [Acidimicrobiales bacterium]
MVAKEATRRALVPGLRRRRDGEGTVVLGSLDLSPRLDPQGRNRPPADGRSGGSRRVRQRPEQSIEPLKTVAGVVLARHLARGALRVADPKVMITTPF